MENGDNFASGAAAGLLLNQMTDGLVALDQDGRIRWMNPAAQRLFPDAFGAIAWEAQPDAFTPDILCVAAEQRVIRRETHLAALERWQEVEMFPLPGGIGVSFRDITERRCVEQSLRESEARLRAVYEHSLDAVGAAVRGVHVFANPAYLALFGFARLEDLVGVPVLDLIAPGEREAMQARMQRRSEGEETETVYETRVLRTDGTEFEAGFRVSSYEQNGEIYTMVVLRDITRRKRAERDLRESEARFRTLAEHSSVGIWQVDPNGRTLYCNPAMRMLLEADSEEEVTGRDYHAFFSEESQAVMRREHARRPGGLASLYEVEILGARGGRRSAVISGAPLLGEDGRLHSLIGTFTDISPWKQAEEARRQAEEKYRSIVENAREGLYQTSPDGRLLSANPALAHLLGYASRDEMLEAVQDIQHQVYVNPRCREEFVQRLAAHGSLTDFELQIYGKDRRILWISENARAVQSDDGTLLHYEGSVVDITPRKVLEADQAALLSEAMLRADRDSLTGLLNHRAFHSRLTEEAEIARSEGSRFAVVAMDLDNFKFFNDAYGHLAGDDVLRQVADALRAHCRASDALARLGGDEFALLMPGLTDAEAREVAARLMQSLASQGYRAAGGGHAIPLRLSVGAAVFPDEGATGVEILHRADERLLESKRGGGGGSAADEFRAAFSRREGFAMLDALVTATDAKDRCTRRHSEEVMALCLVVAGRLGLDDGDRETLALTALLHDIGKIGVPDAILRKPGPLTEEEYAAVKQHASMGHAILGAAPGFETVGQIVRHHHERWDGTGYPDGLPGSAIPPLACLLAVAEAFSAMTADRTYRKGLEPALALQVLREGAGTQWEPAVVTAFADALAEGPNTSTTNEPGA